MDSAERLTFAPLLKQYRAAAGLTQEQLAERAGLSVRGISDLERGVNRRPQSDTLSHLIDALQLGAVERAELEAAAGRSRVAQVNDAISAGPRLPLIGRARELALLSRYLADREPRVLVLAGEPGIGKTRLLEEARTEGREKGLTVLYGGCRRSHGELPYTPVVEALAREVRSMPALALRSAMEECLWLVRLMPELESIVPEPLPLLAPTQERRLVFASVTRFLARVSGSAGALLLLDDLQWATQDALDLLGALADPEIRVPIRIVGAYRDTEVGRAEPLALTLGDLAHRGLASQIKLGPLHMDAAQDLLDALLTAEVDTSMRDRILRRAGGLPFFLVSCAQALQSQMISGDDADHVPWDLAQGIHQRTATLPQSSRDVLHIAAVAGRVASREVLHAVADMPDDALADALDLVCHRGLLMEHGDDAYGFPHDVIREVIERDLGSARRALLHGRIGKALEGGRGHPSAETLAYHFGYAGMRDKARFYLERAGDDAAAQYAHAAAEQSYRDVLADLGASRLELDRARVQEKLSTVLTSLGRYSEALRLLEDASGLYAADHDVDGVGRVTARAGQVHFLRGSAPEGVARLKPVIARLEQTNNTMNLAALHAALADLHFACGGYAEALQAAQRAFELASAAGDARIQARAEVSRGLALISIGRPDDALSVLEEAVPLARTLGDLASLSRALDNIANVYWSHGDFDKHRAHLEQALDAAEQMADPVACGGLMFMLGANALMICEWQRADVLFEHVESITRRLEHSRMSMFGLFGKGALCVARGDWQRAETYLLECIEMAEQTGNLQMLSVARHHWAEQTLLSGRAHEVIASIYPLVTRGVIGDRELSLLHANLARAHLQAGDVAAADDVSAIAIRHATSANDYLARVETRRVQAMVRTAQCQWDEAEQLFVEVHGMVRGVMPYDDGRVLLEWAIMSLRAGEPEKARSRAGGACKIFHGLGARKQHERAMHVLGEIDGC